MKKILKQITNKLEQVLNRFGLGMRAKLIVIFLVVKIIPLIVLTAIAWQQISVLGNALREIAVADTSAALNDSAVENIERMTTDTGLRVADFLYSRDDDILYLANMEPSQEAYEAFIQKQTGRLVAPGEWQLSADGKEWVLTDPPAPLPDGERSTNTENNDMDGFHYRHPEQYNYIDVPLYDEITFIGLDGQEQIKVVAEGSTKTRYPMAAELRDVSKRENTYVKAETYFEKLENLALGEIYVSDVIGAYTRSNYIGMYTPDVVATAAADRGYDIDYAPEEQAYAGMENPNGVRFEGIVRWATPVTGEDGSIIGYASFALNHDHIMEFVDHITPMNERYTQLPNAFDGNYAFIWDYQCRSICHPRHHSIVGYNPETGEPEVPWLETSIYEAWQESGNPLWTDFVKDWPTFDEQSRQKKPAPTLTQQGLVGLDGRYLNNAPQCTGWMDLTAEGGSGSFYILWSGLYKLTTAGAIPYYTGQYAPSAENGYSLRGFGIVTIGAGLEDFTRPATDMEERLTFAIESNQTDTSVKLIVTSAVIILLVVLIAIWMASSITGNITQLIKGISRFRGGERQFRFHTESTDEFGTLADSFDDMADSIVDSVKNPLCITDTKENIIYMNEQALEYCKITLEQAVGTPYGATSIYPAGSNHSPIAALEDNREAEIYHAKESDRYLKGVANHLLDKKGNRVGYIIETTDVTEMVQEQVKIEEQRTLLDKIFSASPDLIWYLDAKGAFLTVNPRFAAISGAEPEDFTGKTATEMLPEGIAETFAKADAEAIETLIPLYTEETIRFADGHEETLESVRTPILDATGEPTGLLGFARNVTMRVTIESELRNTQQDLEAAVNAANRANEHKGEFLARMSHEIRTPMNAIIGITNILQKRLEEMGGSTVMDDVRGNVDQIETSSQHLLGLLTDILDISKIDAGKIELTDEPTDLEKLANTVAGIIKPRCDEKNIRFITNFDRFAPSAFLIDSLRLRQVLINLLGNAVKFTPECGAVEFNMAKREQKDGETLVDFVVKDSGIGIAEDALSTIFQAFEQEGGWVSRQYGGTGLGLAISQRIVQMFGGEITVTSTLKEGSEFRFSLWLRETATQLPEDVAIVDIDGKLEGKHALLVDDVEINRMIVATMMEDTGIAIDEADDGVAAVAAFEQSAPGTYDIVLMDVQMPNMDGYEASMAIRALDRPDAKTVPIIALTANAFKEDIDKALQHGMTAHIAKPVEMDVLLETVFRHLQGGA